MSIYEKYTIEVNLIPGLPTVDFQTANHKATGVVMHSTANYAGGNDSADGERNFELHDFQNAFAHTFTSDIKILQVAPFDNGAYHAFSYANHHFLGNELCQYEDAARFNASYDRWVWLAARQLYDLGLKPQDKVTLWSHLEISQTYQGDHEDPISYLASHGKNWANVVADVTNYYNQMVAEKNGQPTTAKPVSKGMPDNWQSKVIGTLKVTYTGADGVDIHLGNSFDAPVTRVTHTGDGHAVFEQANGMYRISLDEWVTANSNYVTYTPVQPKPAYSGHLIQLNSTDHANVKLIQQKLSIPADGIFGQQTKQAIINFQTAHGLVADGVVGPSSWNALF